MGEDQEKGAGFGSLLGGEFKIINVGLPSFAEELAANGVAVVQVDWTPPAQGDPELADLVSKLGT